MKKLTYMGFGIAITALFLIGFLQRYKYNNGSSQSNTNKKIIIDKMLSIDNTFEVKTINIEMNALDKLIQKSFEEAIKDKLTNEKEAENRYQHMQRVSAIALQLLKISKETQLEISYTKEEVEELMIATYLHDIKKFENKHAKSGAEYIKENLNSVITIEDQRIQRIANIIGNHNNDSVKDSQVDSKLIKLVYDADEIDKIIQNPNKIKEKYDNLYLELSKIYISQRLNK